MSERNETEKKLTLQIPIIKAESETQTSGLLVSRSPEKTNLEEMEAEDRQTMSIRKRRNLSKNRGQAARQREKTPEPGRTPVPHVDTTTSDEDEKPPRNSRELEAETTYLEMKRLVQERANVKDPVYDLDTDEILEARAFAANERRRRSISPFAIPDKEELSKLERKGSFIDPANKLLSTNYTLSPKDEDSSRRSSLTIETPVEKRGSLSPPTPISTSPKEKTFPHPLPTTPKKLEEMVYSDEKKEKSSEKVLKTPLKKEADVFTFEEKEVKQPEKKPTPKTPDSLTPATPGDIVTKVIQVERTPSKKLTADKKPTVEVRERIVRTPSRKMSADVKPIVMRQSVKPTKDEPQSRVPPVKPARSKSATRFGSKTSESEMSEDQGNQIGNTTGPTRKVVPTPRRFTKHRSPRANRSQSVNRVEDTAPKVIDRTGTGMSQTSREIIELMQKARARSLSIPKDDPRLPAEYKSHSNKLQTPNKTPSTTPRNVRGISCPKTIQIISDRVILSGLTTNQRVELEKEKRSSRQSSGYVDASQSEYTSSCYSTSPSENEYEFDLSERTAELARKLHLLSQEADSEETKSITALTKEHTEANREIQAEKPVLKKRSVAKNGVQKPSEEESDSKKPEPKENKPPVKSKWKIIAEWQQYKEDRKADCEKIRLLRNRCICDIILLIIFCGLGGMMFKSFEGSFENAYKCSTRSVKRDFIEALWRGSHYLREDDWKSMARNKLFEFENQLHTAFEQGITSYSGLRSWSFMNSFVYCLTVITTIGYGHIAPKTTYGRVATIAYAIVGIPLFLIVLADFGKLFTRNIKFFWSFIRRFYYTRSCRKVRRTAPMQEMMKGLNIVYDVVRRPSQIFNEEDVESLPEPPAIERKPSDVPPPLPPKPGTLPRDFDNETDPETPAPSVFEIDDEFNLPISVAIVILVIYILIGALVYHTWENWSFFESFYFVFISMSTIGLGDLVPDHPHRMMGSILYLVFGLALTSMCINVVQLKLNDTFKQASAKLGATIGLQVAEDDGSLVNKTPPPTEIVPVHKPKVDLDVSKTKEIENNTSKEAENDSNSKNR
ncbi:uncharacterized protein LOC114360051 [Ostrinia furnacalis]|uniref:uncharacterized protein LOC114360051 n=1 Tax=Ostrinia furnacalis TaxID=93504 RepID=UPI00103E0846|nr:uncharacterized protein LOC114360051 [Ostrinia furnacalis]